MSQTDLHMLIVQGNLANTYQRLDRVDEALRLRRDVYSGWLKLYGQEHSETISAACNYANTLLKLERFAEAKSLLHEAVPVARRVLGNSHDLALKMRNVHARALYLNPGATLADLREAVKTLEETERTARRVLGGAHPLTTILERDVQVARAALRARDAASK